MFTGIIEDLGTIQSLKKGTVSAQLTIKSPLIVSDVKLGDSIAVNGICLTVTSFDSSTFTVDVMMETLSKTNLFVMRPGDKVNLERALSLTSRLGGHLVSGHVDGVGTILSQTVYEIATVYSISYPQELGRYLTAKCSVALDGTSLTVIAVDKTSFTVSLIPHTKGMTTLGFKKPGDTVNLEIDMIARYLEKLLQPPQETSEKQSSISVSFLAENGFI